MTLSPISDTSKMRATRLQSASKRPALAAADPQYLGSLIKMEAKEEKKEEREAEAPPTRKRAKEAAAMLFSPPQTPAARPEEEKKETKKKKPAAAAGLLPPERLGSLPLRCVLSGTNPSETAWKEGHAYAHRSNRFWPLLHSSPGIVPPSVSLLSSSSSSSSSSSKEKRSPFSGSATDDELVAEVAGLGLCDVGAGHPETDLSSIPSAAFAGWAPRYYERLVVHVRRAAIGVGCRCRLAGEEEEEEDGEKEGGRGERPAGNSPSSPSSSFGDGSHPSTCCAPRVIAFTGKRQFVELLNAGREGGDSKKNNNSKKRKFDSSSVGYGLQPPSLRPDGWPRCLSETEVWVLTTTSGAAGLTNEARAAPYLELGRRLASEAWPRPPPPCCAVWSKK